MLSFGQTPTVDDVLNKRVKGDLEATATSQGKRFEAFVIRSVPTLTKTDYSYFYRIFHVKNDPSET